MTTLDLDEAPEIRAFYGRTTELRDLTAGIVEDDRRLVFVQGTGGMGKTRLSLGALRDRDNREGLGARLRPEILARFDHVAWVSLLNAPTLTELARRLIHAMPPRQGVSPPDGEDNPVEQLLTTARMIRCLFVFDNLESLLDAVEGAPFRSGYEDYGRFLARFAATPHESCALLTSREVPASLALLCGPRESGLVYRTPGLDHEACARILADHDVAAAPGVVARVVAAFGANPLAIDLVARRVRAVHGGDVLRVLDGGEMAFVEIRRLLDWHFGRLARTELDVAYCLAVARDALNAGEIAADLRITPAAAGDAVAGLEAKFPLERRGARVTMPSAILEYATERLVAEVVRDAAAGSVASLDRLALYRVSAKEFLRAAQERLVLAPVVDGIGRACGPPSGTEAALLGLVPVARRYSGFAAGNLLNLMSAAGVDLGGRDFSGLSVRGAHLPHVRMVGTDFSGCAFTGCVFATTLGAVLSIATSPDGLAVVTGDNNGEVTSWRVSDGAELVRFDGHREWVRAIAHSPDGRLLATAGSDAEVRVWDAATGRCLRVLQGHAQQVYSVAFDSAGRILASGAEGGAEGGSVILWDVSNDFRRVCDRSFPGRVRSVRFDPSGEILAISCANLQLWRFGGDAKPRVLDLGAENYVRRAVFDPDGRNLAYITGKGRLIVVDTATLATQRSAPADRRANWAEFSPDGATLAVALADGKLARWSAEDFEPLPDINGHPGSSARAIAFGPGGDLLASGGEDGAVCLWELPSRAALRSIRGYPNGIRGVAWSVRGDAVAAACEDGDVYLWDPRDGASAPRASLKGHTKAVEAVVFDPRRERLASVGDDGTARIWELVGGASTELVGHGDWVWCAAFDPNGETLATGGRDRRVLVWDAAGGQLLHELTGHADEVHGLTFLGDRNLVASGSDDNTIRLWRVGEGKAWRILDAHRDCVRSLSFSPLTSLLVSASDDGTIKLWTSEGETVRTIVVGRRRVRCAVFAPDGGYLYSAGDDAVIRKWDLGGRCVAEFPGHAASVWSLSLDPSGERLVSGSADGFIRVWDTRSGEWATRWPTRRYEGMVMAGTSGLTSAERRSLTRLGATFEPPPPAAGDGATPATVDALILPADPAVQPSPGLAADAASVEPQGSAPGFDLCSFLAGLYPEGPADRDFWIRAGGDLARLGDGDSGFARWSAAIQFLERGGGGGMTTEGLYAPIAKDFPRNRHLTELRQALAVLMGE